MKATNRTADIEDVRNFWESNPLWSGESSSLLATKEFFEEQLRCVTEDGFAGHIDDRIFPKKQAMARILDLGCGPGLWTVEFWKRGFRNLTGADLTEKALVLARTRASLYEAKIKFERQNAESLSFQDASFEHVNCQGVIHHTPNTEKCVSEIARVLAPGGTALISVYYMNFILRNWPYLAWLGKALRSFGAKLRGRGREGLYGEADVSEIVRLYDGEENPIGKAYTAHEFRSLLEDDFIINEIYFHYFPARTLPFRIPNFLHKFLGQQIPFMIGATLTKRPTH